MVQQLQKNGAHSLLVLSRELLDRLGLRGDDEVGIDVTNGSLIVTPVSGERREKRDFQECLDAVVERRRDVLRKLA